MHIPTPVDRKPVEFFESACANVLKPEQELICMNKCQWSVCRYLNENIHLFGGDTLRCALDRACCRQDTPTLYEDQGRHCLAAEDLTDESLHRERGLSGRET